MSASFSGARIKRLRQALGLSQIELAALLGVSNITVNRWENGKSAPQPAMAERLRRMEREAFDAPRDAVSELRGSLPRITTPLVGRAAELASVPALLASHPLVTIAGPAGAGKTRLAVETSRVAGQRWSDGIWFVDLSALSEPGDVPYAVARVLGVREEGRAPLPDRIAEKLAARNLLLILDNCEHLASACAALVERIAPPANTSRLLITSRIPVSAAGEVVFPLPPLDDDDAATLFLHRARDHQPELAPDAGQAAAIAEICGGLDGLPLAIELAAARTQVLSVEQIAGRLDQRFALLRRSDADAVPRQRALETAIAWSYDLLGESEAALFRGLGIFAGWFDLAAVEAVREGDGNLDDLEQLAHHSLIVVERDPAARVARYRLLDSLAAYARSLLEARGEMAAVARRHASYYGRLVLDLAAGLRGSEQANLLSLLDREHDNIIAALEWTLAAGDAAEATAVASALGPYWSLRGRYEEGIAWLERVLAAGVSTISPARAAALNHLGRLQFRTGQLDEARQTLTRALALARERGDRGEEARARDTIGLALAAQFELDAAAASHEEAYALFVALGDRAAAAVSRHYLGNLANLKGDHAASERAYHEAWALVQGTGDASSEAMILCNLGDLAARTGRPRRALGYLERARRLLQTLGDPARLAVVTLNTAEARLLLGDDAEAVELAAEAVRRLRPIGNPAYLAGCLYIEAAARAAVGQRQAALALMRESLELYLDLDDWIDVVHASEAIARLLVEGGAPGTAARVLGGAAVVRQREEVADYPVFDYAATIAAVRAVLGDEVMARRWAEGERLERQEWVAEAMLAGDIADGDPVRLLRAPWRSRETPQRATPLTPRQIDVLRLAAAGQSNREIGRALQISARTVERHLTAIYGALGVDRRAAAVAAASAAGLLEDLGL